MVPKISFICLIFILIGKVKAQNYYVAAPKTLRLNSDEVIGVATDGNIRGPVNIYVQDHPGKAKNITQTIVDIDPGKPQLFKIRLDTGNFPSGFLSAPGIPKYVSLTAHFQGYYKELLIPINEKYGYMFIQTDKPIYTPKDRVLFRIIPLNEDSLPSYEKFQLQIRNPNNSIVEQKLFDGKKRGELRKAFATHVYKFPTYPVLGEWSATVQYGYDLKQNSTVHFQLQEYVLPMFTVEIQTPDVILPTDDVISITVSAKYVYGKKVQGVVSFRLGVKKPKASETTFFAIIKPSKLEDGFFNLRINSASLMANEKVGWFPEIQNSHLVVETVVVDTATGNEEEVVDSKCLFTDTPFKISFKRCLEDFRPGHTSIIEADISYANGEPAAGVLTMIEAKADTGKLIEIKQSSTTSDTEGKVSFEARSQLDHKTINIKLTAADKGFLAEAAFKQYAFQSATESYIALDRMSQTLKANDTFKRIIHYEPNGLNNIYYLVTTKGRIVLMNKLPEGKYGDQHVSFKITYEMVPSFRILVFAQHGRQLLVDSLRIDVGNECNPKAEVSIHSEYSIKEPGHAGKIVIRGSQGTYVGLLAVDEAVYALSKKDILTKANIFKRLASHDLGCGAGGGLTVSDVLGKAGIILGTNIYSPSHSYSCAENKRRIRKRAIAWDIVEMYNGFEKECCSLGLEYDIHNRRCEERANVVEHYLKDEEYVNCSKIFLDCCLYVNRPGLEELEIFCTKYSGSLGKILENDIGLTDIDSDLDEGIENELIQRADFRETWIFEDVTIGPDNKEEVRSDLPHSITTWVIQAVSVSPTHGICIAEPAKIVSFQKIFLHLNLPYSVVRNEQVEIQATVFNYDQRPIKAVVYMFGAEGLCSSTQPGQKSERQIVTVEGESAATVTFPVMPLKAETIPIRVVALSPLGSDVIVRELNVVLEGMTKIVNIPITLDPTNLQKRQKRLIQTPYITDSIDPIQNTQATTVKLDLCLPEDFVPGTESCSVSAIVNIIRARLNFEVRGITMSFQDFPFGEAFLNSTYTWKFFSVTNIIPRTVITSERSAILRDIFGPAVQTAINDPENLLIQPGGCGEQNMKKLAPTLYAMRYLKVTGKLTAEIEEKGYKYMREGYDTQLIFKKKDGSYAAFKDTPTSTWLTAFVMKVFCQAAGLIYIDENVLCSGIRWLIDNQQHDGSFVENHSVFEPKLMGGVNGKVPLTAFVLIALGECKCSQYEERLAMVKLRAVAYLEEHLGSVNLPLSSAIVTYALALSGSDLASVSNDNLLRLAKYDEDTNRMHWETEDSAHDIQAAGYALLTQLLLNDMQKSASIVNWLNTKQLQSGAYESTQDTMIALQAMSEYAIKAQVPPINLVTRISSSNDRFSERVLAFNDQNAQVLQDIKFNKVGGTLLINTMGEGTGSLSVNLRYNVIVPPEDICKFDIHVNVTDTKHEEQMDDLRRLLNSGKDIRVSETLESNKLKYRISICVRYLGDKDSDMSIVDVGLFSGFQPVKEDLLKIERDISQLIQKVEMSKRGVIFYLSKIPFSDKYCFNFRVFRQYIVGNTQMSYIKVYDYYNPEATCTKSYKPISNSPVIRTICEGGICQCAEGGCPPGTPFADVKDMKDIAERRNLLKNKFCDKFDYVWKGRLHYIRKEGAFFNISFLVEEVVKAGIETSHLIEQEKRTLLARDNCMTAALRNGVTYLILGKDGQGYMNEYGHIWYRYMLDQTSIVQKWITNFKELRTKESRQLQRDLNYVTEKLKNEGCDM